MPLDTACLLCVLYQRESKREWVFTFVIAHSSNVLAVFSTRVTTCLCGVCACLLNLLNSANFVAVHHRPTDRLFVVVHKRTNYCVYFLSVCLCACCCALAEHTENQWEYILRRVVCLCMSFLFSFSWSEFIAWFALLVFFSTWIQSFFLIFWCIHK